MDQSSSSSTTSFASSISAHPSLPSSYNVFRLVGPLSLSSIPLCVFHWLCSLYTSAWQHDDWFTSSPKSPDSVASTLSKSVKFFVGIEVKSPHGEGPPPPSLTSLPIGLRECPSDCPHCGFRTVGFAFVSGDLSDPLLEDIIVDSDFRRKGLGALLIEEILSATSSPLREAKPKSIDLYCAESLETFYRRHGFEMVRKSLQTMMKRPAGEGEGKDTKRVEVVRCLMRKSLLWESQS